MGLMRRSMIAVAALTVGFAGSALAETPKYGGILKYVVPADPPSYDGHQESTFALIHPIAPFYSLLIKVNPNNPGDPTDFVCDLCVGDVPAPTEGGTVYTFKIHQNVKFHDGQPLTSKDVVASWQKILDPPEGTRSVRAYMYEMVESVAALDDYTIQFKLKNASQPNR